MIEKPPSRAGLAFRNAFLSILVSLILIGCGARESRAERTVFLDEAFSALFPGVASQIGADPIKAGDLSAAIKKSLAALGLRGEPLLASPLAAKRMAEEAVPSAVVFFSASLLDLYPWIWNVEYDFEDAYAAMGKKAVSESDSGAKIGILFQENFMRGSNALKAFEHAVEAARGPDAVVAEILSADSSQIDISGLAGRALEKLISAKPQVLVLAMDDSWAAWLLAREARAKLGTTLKAVYADQTSWTKAGIGPRESVAQGEIPGESPFSLRLIADQQKLARAAQGVVRSLGASRKVPRTTKVPLRLLR